jgi:hypothetical protein
MSWRLRVTDDVAIHVDWKNYSGRNMRKLKEELYTIADLTNPWYMPSDEEIMSDSSNDQSPEDIIETLLPIIRFLNDNKIPWDGYPVAFTYYNLNDNSKHYSGSIIIKYDHIIFIKVDKDGDIEKEYIPTYKNKL